LTFDQIVQCVERNVALVFVDCHGVEVLLAEENHVKSRLTKVGDVEPIRQLTEEWTLLKIQRLHLEHLFVSSKIITYLDVELIAVQGWIEQDYDGLLKWRSHFLCHEEVAEIINYDHADLVDVRRRNIHAQNLLLVVHLLVKPQHFHEILLIKDVLRLFAFGLCCCLFCLERHREGI